MNATVKNAVIAVAVVVVAVIAYRYWQSRQTPAADPASTSGL